MVGDQAVGLVLALQKDRLVSGDVAELAQEAARDDAAGPVEALAVEALRELTDRVDRLESLEAEMASMRAAFAQLAPMAETR